MEFGNLWSGYDLNSKKQNSRCLGINTILAGKYLVGPVLGQGGFGITYLGYDLNMETKIAIKEYFPVELVSRDTTTMHGDRVLSLSGEKSVTYRQGLKKYVAEAQNVSQFSEVPGVVSVKDFFYENETAYIVMEYIDGISLKDYLKEKGGRLSEEETLAIMKPVLEALEKVHNAGIIHRDISPDNIMLTFETSGQAGASVSGCGQTEDVNSCSNQSKKYTNRKIKSVKLIDFGAARMTAKNDQKSLTIILKHGYAPEEQYRTHGEQGPWTDVYAVCAVMYRMLTGETPVPAMDRMFKDELKSFEQSGLEVKSTRVNDTMNQGTNNKKAFVSQNTAAAVMKGLAVKKDDRIQNMQELLAVLYEGAKVKSTKAVTIFGNQKQNKLYMMVGICGAAVFVMVLFISVIFGIGKKSDDVAMAESEIIQGTLNGDESVQAQEAVDEMSNQNAVENAGGSSDGNLVMTEEEDQIGEIIVTAVPQTSLAAGNDHIVVRLGDGTVDAFGSNETGQLNVQDWTHIAAVTAGRYFSAGLREDGVVLVAGELDAADEVAMWKDIVALAAYDDVLFGLKRDGTLVSSGLYGPIGDYYEWSNIKAISCCDDMFAALTEEGNVLLSSPYESYKEYYGELMEITGWTDVVQIVCAQYAVFGITEEGKVRCSTVYTDVAEDHYNFTDMESFEGIVQLYSEAGLIQYGVRQDGSIVVGGFRNEYDCPAELLAWDGMLGVIGIPYDKKYVGLKKDGTTVKTIVNRGNSTPEDMTNLKWAGIISDGDLIGIKKDGTALTYGTYGGLGIAEHESELKAVKDMGLFGYGGYLFWREDGTLYHSVERENESFQWEHVKQFEMDPRSNDYCLGLFEDGTVKIKYSREEPARYEASLQAVEEWTDIMQIAVSDPSNNNRVYGLLEDGSVIYIDAYDSEGITRTEENLKDIKAIFSGYDCIAAIKKDGTAVFSNTRYNDYGQKNVASWTELTQIAMSNYHTVGLREDGTVVATGSNQAGQCDVEDWTDIVYVTVSDNCTLGIQSDGTLMIAGIVGW